MSTKIYNGYKLDNMSLEKANDFYLDLRDITADIAYNQYIKKYFSTLIDIVDTTYYLNYVGNNSKDILFPFLKNIYTDTISPQSAIRQLSYPDKNDDKSEYDKVFDKFKQNAIGYIVDDIVRNKIQLAELSKFNDEGFNFKYEICLLPRPDCTLLLVYNDDLLNELNNLIENNDEFIQQYNLEYYGYWNNTNCPKEIKESDWEQRGQVWKEALKIGHGIPAQSGFDISLFNASHNLTFTYILENLDKCKDILPTKEERVYEKAKSLLLDEFIETKVALEKQKNPDSH